MKKISHHLYFWVLIAIFAGATLGYYDPPLAIKLKPLSDGFIALVKMLISPIIFCTVVLGIVGAGDIKKVGRVGAKALLYFELMSTLALALGLVIINYLKPGQGFNVDLNSLDSSTVQIYAKAAKEQSALDFILHMIPNTFFDAFTASGNLLQVLFIAILFAYAMLRMGKTGQAIHLFIEEASHLFFAMMNSIMKLAPIAAGAAMAFTIGQYGLSALKPLLSLMASFYLTCLLFIFIILGAVSKWIGFSMTRLLFYIKEELLTVLGTSSSESVLVPLMLKLEQLGCTKSVVGLVIPSGYSFNLDGTNIYLSMAAIFIAQALNINLSLSEQLSILGVAMLTSKGASGITGGGFITLAATLAVIPNIPVEGLALIIGIDRFMSEARALTNVIGNSVATLAISHLENELDHKQLQLIK